MAFDSELLDIAQAAALLRVSEASLRRWTNAGRLPCRRIGGRRERRFRRADLMAFLEGDASETPASHVCTREGMDRSIALSAHRSTAGGEIMRSRRR